MAKIVQTAGRNALGEFAPEFAHFNDDVLFGENWNNQDIDVKTRSIITVVALMASGITDSSLKYHLQNAKNHGVTQKEMVFPIGAPNDGFAPYFPAEVKHWHGAAPDEWFSHLAIEVPGENSSNEWLEPVSDGEYRKLK